MNTKIFERISLYSILALVVIVFLREVVSSPFLIYLETCVLVAFLIAGIILAKGSALYFSVFSLGVGHILFFKYQMGFDIWLTGITKNLPLGILLVLVPFLSIPLKVGGYLNSLSAYIVKNINRTSVLFTVLSSFIFIFGSFTNLGGIRVSHDLIDELKLPPKFLAKSFTTGFSACVPWSPYFGSVNLIIYYTGVTFSQYVLYGLGLGLMVLIMGNLLFYRDRQTQKEVAANINVVESSPGDIKQVKKLLLILLGLIFIIIIGEKLIPLSNMMLLVSLVAVFYSGIWSLGLGKFKEFLEHLRGYPKNILQFKNEVLFFISVGFFGVILANTPLQYFLQAFLKNIAGYSTFFLIEFIIIVTVLLSSVGFHQVVTITALSLTITPAAIGLSSPAFSLTLLAAWTVCIIMSPFVPYNILLGGLLRENTVVVGLKWNRTLGLLTTLVAGVYILLVNML